MAQEEVMKETRLPMTCTATCGQPIHADGSGGKWQHDDLYGNFTTKQNLESDAQKLADKAKRAHSATGCTSQPRVSVSVGDQRINF